MIHIRLFAFATRLVWPSISSSFRYGRFASMWLVHKFKAERLGTSRRRRQTVNLDRVSQKDEPSRRGRFANIEQ